MDEIEEVCVCLWVYLNGCDLIDCDDFLSILFLLLYGKQTLFSYIGFSVLF